MAGHNGYRQRISRSGENGMKITKIQLRRIIKEEYSKIIKEQGYSNHGQRLAPVATYGQQIIDAQRSNQLPPPASNWHGFAKALDVGVLDLEELALDMGFKGFANMDAAISPRGVSDQQAEEIAEIMYGISGADQLAVFDALDAPYSTYGR